MSKTQTKYIVIIAVVAALAGILLLLFTTGKLSVDKNKPDVTESANTEEPEMTCTPKPSETARVTPTEACPTGTPTAAPTAEPTQTPEPTASNTPEATPTSKAPDPTPLATTTPSQKPAATPAPTPYIKPLSQKIGNEEKLVALTFDDGPQLAGGSTARLLDGLKERNVKATFFVVGRGIDPNYPEYYSNRLVQLVKREHDEGHLVANHSYSHPGRFSNLSAEQALLEIKKTNDLVESITGERPVFFRAPGGSFKVSIMEAAGMINIYWGHFDAGDANISEWKKKNPGRTDADFSNDTYNYIVNNVRDGDIILMHDIFNTSVDAALKAIDTLQAQGYRFVRLDELLMRNAGDNMTLSTTYVFKTMKNGQTDGLVER